MPRKLDPLIAQTLKDHGFGPDAAWDCHGTWVVYHKVLEQIAAKAGITFDAPIVLEAKGDAKCVALCVKGEILGEAVGIARKVRSEWSIGEAAPGNNKNNYPYAMAEKRAKDRVILKLIGLHGLAYSEDEADDFKESAPKPNERDNPPKPTVAEDEKAEVRAQTENWIEKQEARILECSDLDQLTDWLKARASLNGRPGNWDRPTPGSDLDKILKHYPELFKRLRTYYFEKLKEV